MKLDKMMVLAILAVSLIVLGVAAQRNIMQTDGFGPGVPSNVGTGWAQGTVSETATAAGAEPAQMILFAGGGFRGGHRHIFMSEPDLTADLSDSFGGNVSSFVVVSGRWKLYGARSFESPYGGEFGPGVYSAVEDYGITREGVLSVKILD